MATNGNGHHKWGREVVIGKQAIPNTGGHAIDVITRFQPDVDPIDEELEAKILGAAETSNETKYAEKLIADARSAKVTSSRG